MGLPQYCLDCFVAEAEARQFANIQERCFLEFYVRLDGRAGALLPELESDQEPTESFAVWFPIPHKP